MAVIRKNGRIEYAYVIAADHGIVDRLIFAVHQFYGRGFRLVICKEADIDVARLSERFIMCLHTVRDLVAELHDRRRVRAVFFLLFIAAITSSISLLEVIVAYMTEELHVTRKRAIAYTATAICITGSLCALSMIPDSILTIDGKSLFDLCDSLSSNIMMPLGALFIVLFAGWVLSPIRLRNEMTNHLQYGMTIFPVIRFMIRFVIPIVILLLFLNQIGLFGRLP